MCVERTSHTAGMLGLSLWMFASTLLIFFPSLQLRQIYMPTHTQTSLSQFLDFKCRPSSVVKEDKSSFSPSFSSSLTTSISCCNKNSLWVLALWFVTRTQPSNAVWIWLCFPFLESWVIISRKIILKLNPLTAIFTQHYMHCKLVQQLYYRIAIISYWFHHFFIIHTYSTLSVVSWDGHLFCLHDTQRSDCSCFNKLYFPVCSCVVTNMYSFICPYSNRFSICSLCVAIFQFSLLLSCFFPSFPLVRQLF